jgi:hypothetical protein
MLEVMYRSKHMSDHNMVFVDDIIGYVHEAWWYKNGSRYMKDERFRKKVAKRFGNVKNYSYIYIVN